ncbi:MAG: ribonucleoside-triphosphate reductase [Parcubacteria group bacterium]|nr:ribonucleoside-triphosphate reductase [Parcubacteria group bacterium]
MRATHQTAVREGRSHTVLPLTMPTEVRKRDGRIVSFDQTRITNAIFKAGQATGEFGEEEAKRLSDKVVEALGIRLKLRTSTRVHGNGHEIIPTVEDIQDIVERTLAEPPHQYFNTAKAYILYREEHVRLRKMKQPVPDEVRKLALESKRYFSNQLSEFVYYSTYSKWLPEKGRRETWVETVTRYVDFMREKVGSKLTEAEYTEIKEAMLKMEALGSMRLLWAAGSAARATNVAAYNCSFIAPATWRDFAEIMYVLMCGTGVGFSVERQTVEMLPIIKRHSGKKLPPHVILDSKEGWCDALILGLTTWSEGNDIEFDYSKIRPQGARLKIMGGRASGPGPLKALLEFARAKMFAHQGRRLSTIDVHDIICKIGEAVVMGGVRRSALISLSDLDDLEMREAKNGQFYLTHPERSMANNSAVYNEKPELKEFIDEWVNLVKSGSGERGIFNRGSLVSQVPARRLPILMRDIHTTGTNPCGEIILKSKQFCNLSEVVARSDDTEESLFKKVRIATILGTYQASLTNFPYLSKEWRENCEEEALLGVSITGQWDSPAVRNPSILEKMRAVAIETNLEYAKRFGINPSTSITCVKPSGNGSQLFNSASGCHPRHAEYYIRRVRIERHNPLFMMMKDLGVPYHPEVGQPAESATTFVLEFPVKAPEGAITRRDLSALDLLEHWKLVKTHYTEHNPSVTISVADDEWLKVGNWVYENWDLVGGLSFLPRDEHVYQLAPYEEITRERYEELARAFPEIDFSEVVAYEYEDETTGSKELACVAGTCEIDPAILSQITPAVAEGATNGNSH